MTKASSNPEPEEEITSGEHAGPLAQTHETGAGSSAGIDLALLIRRLSDVGGVPITLAPTPPPVIDTAERLNRLGAVTVVFPPCANELLSLIRTSDVRNKDDITLYFDEYFKFGVPHVVVAGDPSQELDPALLSCLNPDPIFLTRGRQVQEEIEDPGWPSPCSVCSPCLTLNGGRNPLPAMLPNQLTSTGNAPVTPSIRRLFVGDLVWLFHFEWMGIFQILGKILDAYACNGRIPISNGSIDVGVRDDIVAVILEIMVRQTKMGTSSSVRDRACTYRTALGWSSDIARKLDVDTSLNGGFSTLFTRFIYHALEYYKDKRMAVAIRGAAAPSAPPSVATLITISDTLEVLKKRFEAFSYGRNCNNTLSGIVWAIAAMSVIRELRTTLGIPPAFNDPHEYIPAAYDLLVLKRPVTNGETNRYLLHRECARSARDLLLDMEVINHEDNRPLGELENWLSQIEARVEAFRTAYRTLTGIDLGLASAALSQQA